MALIVNFPIADVLALDRYCAGVDDRRSALDDISNAYSDFGAAISERRGRRCKLFCLNGSYLEMLSYDDLTSLKDQRSITNSKQLCIRLPSARKTKKYINVIVHF